MKHNILSIDYLITQINFGVNSVAIVLIPRQYVNSSWQHIRFRGNLIIMVITTAILFISYFKKTLISF